MKNRIRSLVPLAFIAAATIVATTAFAHGGRGPNGPGFGGPHFAGERSVTSLDNGIAVTITSDDPAVIQQIQEQVEARAAFHAMTPAERRVAMEERRAANQERRAAFRDALNVETERAAGTLIVTKTSDDPEVVAHLQAFSEHGMRGPRGEHRGQRGGERGQRGLNVDRSVETITNGVRITFVSDDEEILDRIEARQTSDEPRSARRGDAGQRGEGQRGQGRGENGQHGQGQRGPRGPQGAAVDNVDFSYTVLPNGVEIILTSDDPETVERLQQRGSCER